MEGRRWGVGGSSEYRLKVEGPEDRGKGILQSCGHLVRIKEKVRRVIALAGGHQLRPGGTHVAEPLPDHADLPGSFADDLGDLPNLLALV